MRHTRKIFRQLRKSFLDQFVFQVGSKVIFRLFQQMLKFAVLLKLENATTSLASCSGWMSSSLNSVPEFFLLVIISMN